MGGIDLGFVSFDVPCVKAANCIDPLNLLFPVAAR